MTEPEFDFLRAFLKSRSGLALTPEKRYLAESRLEPVRRRFYLESLAALVDVIGRMSRLPPLPRLLRTKRRFSYRFKALQSTLGKEHCGQLRLSAAKSMTPCSASHDCTRSDS